MWCLGVFSRARLVIICLLWLLVMDFLKVVRPVETKGDVLRTPDLYLLLSGWMCSWPGMVLSGR